MSPAAKKTDRLIVGGSPRADLLPPEIKLAKNARGQRRGLFAIIVLVIILVAVAYSGAALAAAAAQARLDAANNETAQLLAEKAKYSEVTRVQSKLASAAAALRVGTSTEINWTRFLYETVGSLPAGVVLENVGATAASPVADYTQATAPLQPTRMAEITLVAKLTNFGQLGEWLQNLKKVNGYTDVSTSNATLEEASGIYTATVTFHVDTKALLSRFAEGAIDYKANPAALYGLDAVPPVAAPDEDEDEKDEDDE